MSLGAGGGSHGGELVRLAQHAGELSKKRAGRFEIGLLQHDGCSSFDHGLGIAFLVFIGGGGERDEQCGLAGSGQLGHGGGSAAGHDQIGAGKAGGHVVAKGPHLPAIWVGPAFRIGFEGLRRVTLAALVEHGEPGKVVEERGNDARQMLVEDAGALRSAEDQQMGVGVSGRSEGEELRPDGNASNLAVAEPGGCGGKVDGRGLNLHAHEAIGESGDGIGLERHGWNFELQRSGDGGT